MTATISLYGEKTRVTFTGNEDACKELLGDTNRLLFQLRQQVSFNNLPSFSMARTYGDGSYIKAISVNGREQVEIYRPVMPVEVSVVEEKKKENKIIFTVFNADYTEALAFTYPGEGKKNGVKSSAVPKDWDIATIATAPIGGFDYETGNRLVTGKDGFCAFAYCYYTNNAGVSAVKYSNDYGYTWSDEIIIRNDGWWPMVALAIDGNGNVFISSADGDVKTVIIDKLVIDGKTHTLTRLDTIPYAGVDTNKWALDDLGIGVFKSGNYLAITMVGTVNSRYRTVLNNGSIYQDTIDEPMLAVGGDTSILVSKAYISLPFQVDITVINDQFGAPTGVRAWTPNGKYATATKQGSQWVDLTNPTETSPYKIYFSDLPNQPGSAYCQDIGTDQTGVKIWRNGAVVLTKDSNWILNGFVRMYRPVSNGAGKWVIATPWLSANGTAHVEGADSCVFYSDNDGATWQVIGTGIPQLNTNTQATGTAISNDGDIATVVSTKNLTSNPMYRLRVTKGAIGSFENILDLATADYYVWTNLTEICFFE